MFESCHPYRFCPKKFQSQGIQLFAAAFSRVMSLVVIKTKAFVAVMVSLLLLIAEVEILWLGTDIMNNFDEGIVHWCYTR